MISSNFSGSSLLHNLRSQLPAKATVCISGHLFCCSWATHASSASSASLSIGFQSGAGMQFPLVALPETFTEFTVPPGAWAARCPVTFRDMGEAGLPSCHILLRGGDQSTASWALVCCPRHFFPRVVPVLFPMESWAQRWSLWWWTSPRTQNFASSVVLSNAEVLGEFYVQ